MSLLSTVNTNIGHCCSITNAKINNSVLATAVGNLTGNINYEPNVAPINYEPNVAPSLQKPPSLIFKLFNAENGHILEVTDKVPDPALLYSGIRFDNNSKIYILDSSENLGERISQIISIYALQK